MRAKVETTVMIGLLVLALVPGVASAQILSLPDGTVTANRQDSSTGGSAWFGESVTTLTIDAENLLPGQRMMVSGKITGVSAPTASWVEIGLIPKDKWDYWQTAYAGNFKAAVYDKGLYVVHWDSDGLGLSLQEGWDDGTSTTYHNRNGGTQPFAWPLASPTVASPWDFTFLMDPNPAPHESTLSILGATHYGTQPFPYAITDGEPFANDNDYTECYLIAQIWSSVANATFSFTDVAATVVGPPSEVWVDKTYCVGCSNDGHIWQYDAFDNIQDGIDAVAGSTVNVAAGLYEEQVVVTTDNVHILGAGSGGNPAADTIIRSPVSLTYSFNTGTNDNYPVVGFDGVTGGSLENLRVDGYGRGNGNYRFDGVAFWNAGGDVEDCVVTGIMDTPFSGAQHGVGIYAYNNTGGPYTVNVSGTEVVDYQKNAMALIGTGLTANVSNCTTTGAGATAVTAQNGIQISVGAGGTIDGCTVSDNIYTGSGWAATGVLLLQGTSVDVTDTVITDNTPGVYCQDTPSATFDGITVDNQDPDSWDGFYAYNSTGTKLRGSELRRAVSPFSEQEMGGGGRAVMNVTVTDSTFTGLCDKADNWGIGAFGTGADAVNLTVTSSTVTNWDYGIVAYDYGYGTPVNVTVHDCNIFNNASYGIYSFFAGPLDAENNWWGDASGPFHSSNPAGLGDVVSDGVDFDPWTVSNPRLTLEPDETCYMLGETVTVELWMHDITETIDGGQFFLAYDNTKLDFDEGTTIQPGGSPFTMEIIETVNEVAGTIDYAVGIPFGGTGTSGGARMAVITFEALADICDECDLITWRPHDPPSRLTDDLGDAVYPLLVDMDVADDAPPVISGLTVTGGDVDANCQYTVNFEATVTDDCCVDAADVTVGATLTTGNATLGTPNIAKTQVDAKTVTISGDVLVSDLTGCPATVQVTVDAVDCCGNAVAQAVETADVNDVTPPVISSLVVNGGDVDAACEYTVTFSGTVTDNCCVEAGDVTVGVTEITGNGTLTYDPGTDLTITQVDANTVNISGSALISDLTDCPATVQVTVDADDCCGNSATQALATADVDDITPPVLSGCPSDITVNADAGGCTAVVTWTNPTATDNCDPSPVVVCTPSSGSVFPQGTTLVTCTATDACLNTSSCSFNVTVSDYNELVVDVELSPNVDTTGSYPQTLTRCVTFELWDCPASSPAAVVSEELVFTKTGSVAPMIATGQVVEVPCGAYSCITARDELHTLRRTTTLGTQGTEPVQYTADFAGDPAGGGDWLIGGNLNDDYWIDILDFGVFSWQWAANYGSGDTDCSTSSPHADVSGNGIVNTADFTFIQNNFLDSHEANCCGQPGLPPPGDGPVTAISLAELYARGLGHLAVADLNGDEMVDQADVQAFMMGARPQPAPEPAPEFQRVPMRPGRAH